MKEIKVIIPTLDRLESLQETLRSLEAAHRPGLEIEIVVVNNLAGTELEGSLTAFQTKLNVVVLNEPTPGKSHALNRALSHLDGGDLIAVVDDDISVDPGWFQDIVAISARWPEKGFFGGTTRIEWPDGPLPAWSQHHSMPGSIRSWMFSINGVKEERALHPGEWVSGNLFWVRTQHLPGGFRFDCSKQPHYLEMTEPKMMFDLTELGHGGVHSPLATAKHRLQAELIDFEVLKKRAALAGRGYAEARLRPFRRISRQAVLLKKHPLTGHLYCRLK